jgi:hypothetical protein
MRPKPLIALADVESGSRWFQQVLGLSSGHGGTEYEMLLDGGDLVLQLHQWEADEHAHLGEPTDPSRGNGTLLWFATDDFDLQQARERQNPRLVAETSAGRRFLPRDSQNR